MLPYLEKKQAAGRSVQLTAEDSMNDVDQMRLAASDLLKAIETKNIADLADALRSAMMIMEGES